MSILCRQSSSTQLANSGTPKSSGESPVPSRGADLSCPKLVSTPNLYIDRLTGNYLCNTLVERSPSKEDAAVMCARNFGYPSRCFAFPYLLSHIFGLPALLRWQRAVAGEKLQICVG